MTNALKHAQSEQVDILPLPIEPRRAARATTARGFDPAVAPAASSFGLTSYCASAPQQIGGRVAISSHPAKVPR